MFLDITYTHFITYIETRLPLTTKAEYKMDYFLLNMSILTFIGKTELKIVKKHCFYLLDL